MMDPLPQPGEPEIVPVPILFERAFSNRSSTVASAGSGPGCNVPVSTSETFMREVLEADLHTPGARVGCEWRGRGYLEWGQRFEVSAVPFDLQNHPSIRSVNVPAVPPGMQRSAQLAVFSFRNEVVQRSPKFVPPFPDHSNQRVFKIGP